MLKRSFAALLGVLLMIGACLGCGPQGDISSGVAERDFPVTVNEVTIQDEPKGVVVLSPNLAEVILALGYEMQLCGKGAACTQEDLSVLPDMTMDDPQSILGVGADLVLTEQSPTEEQKKGLNDAGVDVVTIAGRKDCRGDFQYHRRHQPPDSPDGYAGFRLLSL